MSWRGGLVVVAAIGCGDGGSTHGDAGICTTYPCEVTVSKYPLLGPVQIDMLWVIDNSPGTAPLQAALATAFPSFTGVLDSVDQSDTHIAVISGDVGAGAYDIPGCSGFGDNGQFQYAPRSVGCTPATGRFMETFASADGTRETNYTGSMADAFNCVSKLGTGGCPYQQPLEAARRALAGDGISTGFLRDDAYLALMFVTTNDDCSASDSTVFDPASAGLGPASTFRCFEHGAKCNPDAPTTAGAKTACLSRETSPYFTSVQSYVDIVKGLKKDPSKVFVHMIAGPSTLVTVDVATEPSLRPACSSDGISAAPAIRLKDFANTFPNRYSSHAACSSDLSGALTQIAQTLRVVRGRECLPPNVTMPLQCRVEEIRIDGPDEGVFVRELPKCDNEEDPADSGNLPCFALRFDDFTCAPADQAAPYYIDYFPITRKPTDNVWAITKCLVDSPLTP